MVDRLMGREILFEPPVLARIVRIDGRGAFDLLAQDRAQSGSTDAGNVVAAGLPAALYHRQNLEFVGTASVPFRVVVVFPPERLVNLDRATTAQQTAAARHGFPDPVGHEPSGPILNAQHPVKLVAGYALFAGTHQVNGYEPLGQRHLGALENGSHGHAELFFTPFIAALVQAGADLLTRTGLDRVDTLQTAAMDTRRTVRPAGSLNMLAGGFFVGELRGGQIAHFSSLFG